MKDMEFEVEDTLSIYTRIVEERNVARKREIYMNELMRPYEGVFNTFGGSVEPSAPGLMDASKLCDMWGYLPPERLREEALHLLNALEERGVWEIAGKSLEKACKAFESYADKIHLDHVLLGIFLSDPSRMAQRDRGFAGFGAIPGYVMLSFSEPNEYSIGRLPGSIAHELHHGIRTTIFRWNPMTLTVGDYIVIEGLAESFATALYGEKMLHYAMAEFDQKEIPRVKEVIGSALGVKGFNEVRPYIFGDTIAGELGAPKAGLPYMAGYTMGYHVVQSYLKETGKSIEEATFVPADEIVRDSKYFK
jgi:uncharacterized protein YjaZ